MTTENVAKTNRARGGDKKRSFVSGGTTVSVTSDSAGRGGNGRKILFVAIIAVLLPLVWNYVDAIPTLFLYDTLLRVSSTTKQRLRKFKGKTVWVTGASSGIGAELVCLLVEAEAKHIVMSSRHEAKLREVAKNCSIRSSPEGTVETKFSIVPFDAAAPDIDNIVQKARTSVTDESIDVLILNAGIYQMKPALDTDIETVKRIMKINFETPVALSTSLIKADQWRERGHGHLVVVSSIIGRGAHSLTSSYSASKHALRGYFHTLSTEEHSWLRVDVALPGATDTGLWTTAFDETVKSNPSSKLSPERCAMLILTGAVGPHFLFYETWMSKALGLIWTYLSLFPNIFHWSIHLLGTIRLSCWEEDGTDALELPTLLRHLWKVIRNQQR